jgi:hypothetical protein
VVIEEKIENAGSKIVEMTQESLELKEKIEQLQGINSALEAKGGVDRPGNKFLELQTSEQIMENLMGTRHNTTSGGTPNKNSELGEGSGEKCGGNLILGFRKTLEAEIPRKTENTDPAIGKYFEKMIFAAVTEYAQVFEQLLSMTIKLEANSNKLQNYQKLLDLNKGNIVLFLDQPPVIKLESKFSLPKLVSHSESKLF